MPSNPLLVAFEAAASRPQEGSHNVAIRDELISRFSFAIPTSAALAEIALASPSGVIEVGAGTGYWAGLLAATGTDVIAFDADPPPSPTNPWFAGGTLWFNVQKSDETVAGGFPQRTLLLVWPTIGAQWAADAVRSYHAGGGGCVAFVGEVAGGRTGDDSLHKMLGNATECLSCRYGILDVACLCGIPQYFEPIVRVALPHWPGFEDDLTIHRRRRSRPRRRLLAVTRRGRTND